MLEKQRRLPLYMKSHRRGCSKDQCQRKDTVYKESCDRGSRQLIATFLTQQLQSVVVHYLRRLSDSPGMMSASSL